LTCAFKRKDFSITVCDYLAKILVFIADFVEEGPQLGKFIRESDDFLKPGVDGAQLGLVRLHEVLKIFIWSMPYLWLTWQICVEAEGVAKYTWELCRKYTWVRPKKLNT
jgi:hypothetical protein